MNAGAYGGEIKDVLIDATVLTAEGELKTVTRDELDLSYRHSLVPEKGYICLSLIHISFLEAIRQFQHEVGHDNAILCHVTLIPYLSLRHI